ncbi:aminotransferase class III-fold pyridoxal phosphate-dependent enzyme [Sphingobium sp. YR768]|uniref:aminotransferase class III-fold pyridoxal phosphate-dependent enzyme n=1 Tax=Sphingobium sp. YR768 TaxID=1884365 RepID=UPI0008C30AD5|nr:aminotransferase class III-fold pyridoxal phosphate-dependent enzyme [Sphingobium sp. YR768]SES17264.1 Aminotransferase class-III [Sphingobium sp. YR768]
MSSDMMGSSDLMAVYNRAPVEVERGEGMWLHATDGRSFLDCVASIATNSLGHTHPALVAALISPEDVIPPPGNMIMWRGWS